MTLNYSEPKIYTGVVEFLCVLNCQQNTKKQLLKGHSMFIFAFENLKQENLKG